MNVRHLLWIAIPGAFVAGCVGTESAWKPLTPGDFGSHPAAIHAVAHSVPEPGELKATFRITPVTWRIPSSGSSRSRAGRPRQRLYSQPQPELGPLPPPGPATAANPLFPAP